MASMATESYLPRIEELQNKFQIGVLHHAPKAEFTAQYQKIIEKYQIQEQMVQLSQQKGKNEPEAISQEQERSDTEDTKD